MTDPTADLTYYAEPPWEPIPAGVQKGYLVVRNGDEATTEVADMALIHDGEGHAVGQIDHSTWRRAEIVDDS